MLCFYYKHKAHDAEDGAGDEVASVFLNKIESHIRRGLGLQYQAVELDWERLENAVRERALPEAENEGRGRLLAVIAEAVAEAGPWKVSTGMIANKAGCSKSALYSHFASREEMIKEFIVTEITRVSLYAKDCSLLSKEPSEQIYLVIAAIAHYLKQKADVLQTIDKLRLQKPNFKKNKMEHKPFSQIHCIFQEVKKQDGTPLINERDTEWILFLVVSFLQVTRGSGDYNDFGHEDNSDVPNENLRMLFRYIVGGI
jgi:hypothetical protein